MGRLRDERSQRDLDDLDVALGKCAELLLVLGSLLGEQPGLGPRGGTIGRYPPESKEPWAAEAANAYWLIWFGSRTLADRMRAGLGLQDVGWPRGGHGLAVIRSVASVADEAMLRDARQVVERWRDTALQIRDIDEADRWVPVPRALGSRPPQCPYCKTMSLRLNRARGVVRCAFPGCADSAGNPTQARMEFVPDSGEGILVFDDDMTLTFRSAA